MKTYIEGIGEVQAGQGLDFVQKGEIFESGRDGVKAILAPADRKTEFVAFEDKTLCYVKSALGYPAVYPLKKTHYSGRAKAVLMDLDGTSVHSEGFWIYIIERTVARMCDNSSFKCEQEDLPHVAGHSVSEHLKYCIDKYAKDFTVEAAREIYYEIYDYEIGEIMHGRGRPNAFMPAPDLKKFLLTLKSEGVKIGLVTSGLYTKAWPEILSAFQTLEMGDPLDFYDAVITAGQALKKGQCGTIGELAPKPHPWLYSETARVGLGLQPDDDSVIGIEDSGAGVISVRLAGFPVIGLQDGNITSSGLSLLCHSRPVSLVDALPDILG